MHLKDVTKILGVNIYYLQVITLPQEIKKRGNKVNFYLINIKESVNKELVKVLVMMLVKMLVMVLLMMLFLVVVVRWESACANVGKQEKQRSFPRSLPMKSSPNFRKTNTIVIIVYLDKIKFYI